MERFYLIVGHVDWIERLVPHGVKLVQLRIKDEPEKEVHRQVKLARELCAHLGAQLVVNDYWQMALELGCDFVHLGQEDMDTADFAALRNAGIRFGLSTHDEGELERALSFNPEYIALGPVYPTLLKKMKWAPQGLDHVTRWKSIVGSTPLVAIGGLTPERLPDVFAAGADSAAVVTDIQRAADPVLRTKEWVEACRP
ncbi:thiamine phosphate synthase [Pseudovibrio sp. Tun.PSC04-5.I4]|uniref:thiamine phosphate synthase n=1 Tax=Pseudovibrio sp. Tun.PSC04-5.I4 TaxID=1798213 RepID=UPI00088EDBD5|nr:thiamine phosphate synthase [Pseudovibrio sp. Tun.PSC04-5.I4]SDQ31674.1 thiamine-phosphate diphosphorylase [Pseudovibrio sp. Tun.PSC04-5.I4]